MKLKNNKFEIQGLFPVFLLILKISALLVSVWALIENTLILSVRKEKLGDRVKIAHISDIHKRKFGKRIVKAVRKQNPDIIIISGDLVSRNQTDFSTVHSTIQQLCRLCPVYMAFGNHEQSIPKDKFGEFLKMLRSTEVILLRNEYSDIAVRGKKFKIYGLEVPYSVYKKDGGYRNLDKIQLNDVKSLIGECPQETVLLIAHNPLFADVYSQWGADFVFSGHVHGGVVRVFNRGLLSPERKLFPKYSKGIFSVGNTKIFVSAGIGKLRLFNPPEIPVYTL